MTVRTDRGDYHNNGDEPQTLNSKQRDTQTNRQMQEQTDTDPECILVESLCYLRALICK